MTELKMNKVLSRRDEDRLIKASQDILLNGGYPNPDRAGCPRREVLKGLAERKAEMREAEHAIVHLGSCSPCFIEYTEFQKQSTRRNALEFVLASVALVALVVLGGWIWKVEWGNKPNIAANTPQRATLDLRNRLVFRDDGPPSANSGPIQLGRGRLDLTILLPPESRSGNYEVEVLDVSEKSLVATSGVATNQSGIMLLHVKLDISSLSPGTYILQVGSRNAEQRRYPLILK